MGGGTKSSEKSELPQWYVDYAQPSLDLANQVAQVGYRPTVGPELAGFAPQQVSGMQQAADWSSAFNTPGQAAPDVASQLMQPNSSINGMPAFSSFPQYQESMDLFKQLFPGQAADIARFSKDPMTGAAAPAYGMFPGGASAGAGAPAPAQPKSKAQIQHDIAMQERQGRGGNDPRGGSSTGGR